ncbi:type II secretion system minor pseudopilin GspK [soil metagenome]
MKRVRKSNRQRGVAVITALLLTTLAITIVASLFWQQQVQVRSIENQRLQLQKQWVLRGALDWAVLILREDAKTSSVDHLGEPWAVPLADTQLDQYVENGKADGEVSDASLSGNIVDAQSRYNLKNLAAGGVVNPGQVKVFERLLETVQVKTSLAQATAELIASAQKKMPDPSVVANQSSPPSQRTLELVQVQDLLAVPGFTPQFLARVKDFVIILPETRPINANTASPEVLSAVIDTLSLSDANALVASREHAYFKDLADFGTRLGDKATQSESAMVDFSTTFFLVNGKVRLSRASLEVQALVWRPSNSGITKLIWIREN